MVTVRQDGNEYRATYDRQAGVWRASYVRMGGTVTHGVGKTLSEAIKDTQK